MLVALAAGSQKVAAVPADQSLQMEDIQFRYFVGASEVLKQGGQNIYTQALAAAQRSLGRD